MTCYSFVNFLQREKDLKSKLKFHVHVFFPHNYSTEQLIGRKNL